MVEEIRKSEGDTRLVREQSRFRSVKRQLDNSDDKMEVKMEVQNSQQVPSPSVQIGGSSSSGIKRDWRGYEVREEAVQKDSVSKSSPEAAAPSSQVSASDDENKQDMQVSEPVGQQSSGQEARDASQQGWEELLRRVRRKKEDSNEEPGMDIDLVSEARDW
jgi:hypothetical protein